MINPSVIRKADDYRQLLMSAEPFQFVVIDDFLEPVCADKLIEDFPRFDPRNAINEFGEVGGKAVVEKIDQISSFYEKFFNYIKSNEFLDVMTALTAIPGLVPDPGSMYGGGTHENLHNQELDPHVDFNYLDPHKLHRRLNLLIFLNKEWEEEWGGSVEFHSNPRDPKQNKIKSFLPSFNRCVVFETNERSWHGFRRIQVPENKRHLSRKSISIYLYTRDRPADEIAPRHSTFYVQRPLPKQIESGYTLTQDDYEELYRLVTTRDKFIEFYQKKELADSSVFENTLSYLEFVKSQIRLPLTGYVLQTGLAKGYWPDGWVSPDFDVTVAPQKPIREIVLRGYAPEMGPKEFHVTARINGKIVNKSAFHAGLFELSLNPRVSLDQPVIISIDADVWFNPKRDGSSEDDRDLIFKLLELRFLHD